MIIATVAAEDKTGKHDYEIRLLHEFGIPTESINSYSKIRRKIADLFIRSSEHDSLFSDYTRGSLEAFTSLFMDTRGVWAEIVRVTDDSPIGVGYLTDVIVHFDADAHFALWDGIAQGREPIFIELMRWAFDRYDLHRMTAEIPAHMLGTIRMTKRLGFTEEGTRRDANLHKGGWVDAKIFGILKEELNGWRNEVIDSGRDQRGDWSSRPDYPRPIHRQSDEEGRSVRV